MFEEYQKIYSKGKLTVHLKSTKVLLLLHQWYITSVFAVMVCCDTCSEWYHDTCVECGTLTAFGLVLHVCTL